MISVLHFNRSIASRTSEHRNLHPRLENSVIFFSLIIVNVQTSSSPIEQLSLNLQHLALEAIAIGQPTMVNAWKLESTDRLPQQ